MPEPQPTAAIERGGVKTVRWASTDTQPPRYVLWTGHDDTGSDGGYPSYVAAAWDEWRRRATTRLAEWDALSPAAQSDFAAMLGVAILARPGFLTLTEPQAREALKQLAYLLGCQVVAGG